MQHLPAPASDVNGAKVNVRGGRDAYLLLLLGVIAPSIHSHHLPPHSKSSRSRHIYLSPGVVFFFFKPGNYLKIEPPTPRCGEWPA